MVRIDAKYREGKLRLRSQKRAHDFVGRKRPHIIKCANNGHCLAGRKPIGQGRYSYIAVGRTRANTTRCHIAVAKLNF